MFYARIKRLNRSLGWRLSLWYALGFIVSFGLVGLFALWIIQHNDRRVDRAEIREEFDQDAARCQQVGTDAFLAAIRAEQPDPETTLLRLSAPAGATLLLVPPFDASKAETRGIEGQLSRHRVRGWRSLQDPGTQYSWQVYAQPMPGGIWLQVAKSDRHSRDNQARLRSALLPVTGLVVLAALVSAGALTKRALHPIRQLTETARKVIQSGDMTARVPTRSSTGNELDDLKRLFNGMLARNESLIRGMREALDHVAHDLRTPLTRLRACAEATLRDKTPTLESRGEALGEAVEESERILAMLRTLLDISEAEHGTMRLQLEPAELTPLVAVAVDLYEHVAEERKVQVRVEVPAGLRVLADPVRVQQVLSNLLDNAIKYSHEGGTVSITAGDGGQTTAEAWLSVQDKGLGISARDLPRIWDRLYRGDQSRSEAGHGLGLSLVKAVVEAHGGRATVQSEPGQGARFTVFLPASRLYVLRDQSSI